MPKMKSRKSLTKRVKMTASGRLKHKKQGLRHILTKKGSKRKRHLRALTTFAPHIDAKLKKMLA